MAFQLTPGKLGFKLGDVLVGLQDGSTDVPEALKTTSGRLHSLGYAWNPDTLAWEVATISDGGLAVSVTNPGAQPLAVRLYAASSTVSYVCKAVAGAATSSAVWQVFRMTTTTGGDLTIEYADGNDSFDNIADNYLALNYS